MSILADHPKGSIVISGMSYTGTTTIARELSVCFELDLILAGERFRDFCNATGLDPSQTDSIPRETHIEFDDHLRLEVRDSSQVVIEGRIAIWIASEYPNTCRIWCQSGLDTRVLRCEERDELNSEDARQRVKIRDANEIAFYRDLYGIDLRNMSGFADLILDSSQSLNDCLAEIRYYVTHQ